MANIFICYTPLHTLIAGKILELKKIHDFILIYYYEEDNAKHKFYFNKISPKAKRAFYIKIDNKILSALKTFFFLYSELNKEPGPVNFFAGNIKPIYSRMVIFLTGFKTLYTFDDGVGNVSGEGYFYNDRDAGFFSRLLSFLGLHFTYASIIKKIKKHYTLYTLENVMPNAIHINLFDNGAVTNENRQKETVVLLTSPFYEDNFLDIKKEKLLYNKIIKQFNVSYVIPHPRERLQKINTDYVEIIESEKIAEEILLNLKQRYKNIKVLGIYSSALLNLNGIEGIEITNIHFDLNVSLDKLKNLFSSVNIDTVAMN